MWQIMYLLELGTQEPTWANTMPGHCNIRGGNQSTAGQVICLLIYHSVKSYQTSLQRLHEHINIFGGRLKCASDSRLLFFFGNSFRNKPLCISTVKSRKIDHLGKQGLCLKYLMPPLPPPHMCQYWLYLYNVTSPFSQSYTIQPCVTGRNTINVKEIHDYV